MRRRVDREALRHRADFAGPVVLSGTTTGLGWRFVLSGFTVGLVILVLSVIGFDFMAQDGPGGNPGDLSQIMRFLEQMANEQQQQRAHLDTLQQALGTTAQGVGMTQQVTEGVVTEVVQQVQAAMQQRQQEANDQMVQVQQVVQTMQQQLRQLTAAQTPVPPSPDPKASSQVPPAGLGVGGVPPFPGVGGATQYNIGSPGAGGFRTSPAVAHAIQAGGVDSKQLAKPSVFNPLESKVNFLDWSDTLITISDSVMPGIYELLEWIATDQPKTVITQSDVQLHFPAIGTLLISYADTNVYAMLSSYTAGEARSLVRQAKRPNGYEAFRLLHIRFNPTTIGRQRANLMRITNPQENIAIDKLAAEIVAWENLIVLYESRPGADKVSESMKMAALVHMAPQALKQHLHMNAARYTSYFDLREEIMSYVEQVAPVTSTSMDVSSVGVSKGGGCFLCGGPHLQRDCKKKGKVLDERSQRTFSVAMPCKGVGHQYNVAVVVRLLRSLGLQDAVLKSDTERSLVALRNDIQVRLPGIAFEDAVKGESQTAGPIEGAVSKLQGMARTLKSALEGHYGAILTSRHPVLVWMTDYTGTLLSRFNRGPDGRTPYERSTGKKWNIALPEFGEGVLFQRLKGEGTASKLEARFEPGIFLGLQEATGLRWVGTETGVVRTWTIRRRPVEDQWKKEELDKVIGLPWQLKPKISAEGLRSLPSSERPIEIELPPKEEEPAKVERKSKDYIPCGIYIRRDVELQEFGFTDGCDGCEAAKLGLAHRQHSRACKARIVQEKKMVKSV